ncbi:MAG: FAD-binding oxidoreductase [Eubacteriales bacterium]|nr:FAD-binding oxidoreductase [Eubacteriales bacterium]
MQKIKMSLFSPLDMLKFKNIKKNRDKKIKESPSKEVSAVFPINENALLLHPDKQVMIIENIILHKKAKAKSFVLKNKNNKRATIFRAGQYISVLLKIGDSILTRPYSISSSPKLTLEGKIIITIKKNECDDAFASNYILENWKINDEVIISSPCGNLYYENLRDSNNVLAIVGGSSITPILSMAYSIRDAYEDFNLNIIYGSNNEEDILLKENLDKLASECDKIKVKYVIQNKKDNTNDLYEYGFITKEIIEKYAFDNTFSIYLLGPKEMQEYIKNELKNSKYKNVKVRTEMNIAITKPYICDDFPKELIDKTFNITIHQGLDVYNIKASTNEPLLCAIERAGINAPSSCRNGECGFCKSKLISGKIYTPKNNSKLRKADIKFDYFHPCASFPCSDLEIEIPNSYLY